MLHDLLYKDRLLVDYPDKELSIWPTEDWPYFSSYRDRSLELGTKFDGLDELKSQAISYIRDNGPVCSDTLPIEGEIYWHSSMHWSGNWDKKSPAARTSPTPPIARTVARDSRKETVCFYVPIRVKI